MDIRDYLMYKICSKLQKMKHKLRVLHKGSMSSITSDLAMMRSKLHSLQDALISDFSEPLREEMVHCTAEVQRLVDKEMLYYKQLPRSDWIQHMDRNTEYFEALIRGKRRKSRIMFLQCSDGSRASSREEIQREVLGFYQDLIGSPRSSSDSLRSYYTQQGTTLLEDQAAEMIGHSLLKRLKSSLWYR
ncbi:hypothetical protein Droror1_Dr00016229 [Drosera rotundifolia]